MALFTISGGILIKGDFVGTPKFNLILLLIGTSLASWMGTTGAAMLLIRPLIRANKWREEKTHIIIFFIFLVANIGGSLTPLGDPPLFIGFLKGIDFFWTTKYMLMPMIFVSIFDNKIRISFLLRDMMLFLMTFISYKITPFDLRIKNGFTWFPIKEVAKLFAGIFITVIPALSLLSESQESFSSLTSSMYFWLTGILSSFLDNAPTYLVFFTSTGLSPNELMLSVDLLLAISSGAVFMGAMTYIGNAPNFMVRAIAEENGVKMPGFFGYMLWSFIILVPIFILYTYLWF